MDEVFALVEKDILPEWGSVIAVSQDCGRGQLRRAWKSPPGNVYGSLRLPNHSSRLDLWGDCMDGLIPLVAGYVFCVALEQMGAQVRLKWPNDFVFRERKVGGMLIEERGDVRVLGVGINLASCPDDSEMPP
jgi:BirA family biotin operon repressor/biotin-[acetyl-CoA-carboxylase] ligase